MNHLCEIILNFDQWLRRCHVKKNFMDDDGHRTKNDHKSSPLTQMNLKIDNQQ